MDFGGSTAAKNFGGGWRASKRPCDNCGSSAAAALYCKADAAFLCLACDAGVHGANELARRHERAWMCEVCELGPAAFSCKADAAALCASCDADVHSANPLAGRHVRTPLEPFFGAAASPGPFAAGSVPEFLALPANDECCGVWGWREEDEEEATSWFLPNPTKAAKGAEAGAADAFWNEVDPFIEFKCGGSMAIGGIDGECLVPAQAKAANPTVPIRHPHQSDECFDVSFSTPGDISPLSQSLSTSLDFGVVPDENSAPETPRSDFAAHQLSTGDREARVSRYREKRKNRRFEKTIRYASRKAYAEARPRIKGRFVKRDPVLKTEDNSFAVDAGAEYGVVPTFSHVPIN